MSVGANIDKNSIDVTVAGIAKGVKSSLALVQAFKAWLDTQPDGTLITKYSYVQGEVDILRSAINDLDKFRAIFEGTQVQSPAYDFRTFAKLLWGIGL